MHIITQKRIWDGKKQHPEAASALDGWYRLSKKNQFRNFSQLKQVFKSVDKVKEYYVFDIGGNKLRLITNIHFSRQKIYIRDILTHKEYEKNKWQQD